MNSLTSTNNHFSLHNVDNYKSVLANSLNDILDKYIHLICEYLKFIVENIKIKNKTYFTFILMRGLETITHVFNNIIFFSKNLDMAYYHGQKSFYYYVEFIGQITEEKNVFLKLSSRDASMYVYKKTIFEITNEHRKISTYMDQELSKKLDGLQLHIQIYKNIIYFFLTSNTTFKLENKSKQQIIEYFIYRFEILSNKINSVIFNNDEAKGIGLFVDILNTEEDIEIEKYLDILDSFSKKICKTIAIVSEKKFKRKKIDDNFNIMIKESPDKFISWFFTNQNSPEY